MVFLLGLDVGTTATKALLFDLEGSVVASAQCNYGLIYPNKGWVEQDPEELWRGVVQTLQSVAAQVGAGDRIVALSQSSQAGTTIPVDADWRPTYNAVSWMDRRSAEQAEEVREEHGAAFIHSATGWPLFDGFPLQHVRWLRRYRPDVFADSRRFMFVNDFILQRLSGQWYMNPSDAGITQFMNIASGDWDERLLDMAGIARDQVSPIFPSGHAVAQLTPEASEETGVPHDIIVVNGAHDQYCAAVGTGVTRPGEVLLSCGTAWVVLAVSENLDVALRSQMAVSQHAVKGRWGALRSLGGVGTSLVWLLDNVWAEEGSEVKRENLYAAVNDGVARSPIGSKGLIFYPLAGGHKSDLRLGRGGFIGLSLSHSRGDMARAVMEGTACELRWLLEEVREVGVGVSALKMVGGAAQSDVWPQIVADVCGVPVTVPKMKQAASRGAAILAGVGAGLFEDPEAGFQALRGEEKRLKPCAENLVRYGELYDSYRRLYEALASELKTLGS